MINRILITRICAVSGVLLIAACAARSGYENDQQKLERYRQYAGAPVDHITSDTNYGGLTALGPNDVVYWADSRRPYLITVNTPCQNLLFADGVGVTHDHSVDTIYARFDSLIVNRIHCTIAEIRPVDYARLRQDERTADVKVNKPS